MKSASGPSGSQRPGVAPKHTTKRDRDVGLRVATLRKERSLSQGALGQAIGVTFQQVQKYEKGVNRIGAGRLSLIAQVLNVPTSALFGDAAENLPSAAMPALLQIDDAADLLHAFAAIENPRTRGRILDLVKSIAQADGAGLALRPGRRGTGGKRKEALQGTDDRSGS